MTDTHTTNGTPLSGPVPPAGLIARAAEILGLPLETTQASRNGTSTVVVTVAGPDHSQQIIQVPTDVPVARLVAKLGTAVAVPTVGRVTLGGEAIDLGRTLGDIGVRAGSVLTVYPPSTPTDAPSRRPGASTRLRSAGAPAQERLHQPQSGYWSGRRRAAAGAAVAGVVAVSSIAGAALAGGSESSPPVSKRTEALAVAAATAWVDGGRFAGPRLTGVPADLGRTGPATGGTLEAVGTSTAGKITSQLFIVAPPTAPAYGLSVVVYGGRIAYPPTVTGLPFATTIPAGGTPVLPQTGKIVTPTATATRQAQRWADTVLETAGPLGYRPEGAVTVIAEWVPTTRATLVTRVRVTLAGITPGTPEARAAATAQAAADTDTATVAADRTVLAAVAATVAQDLAAVASDDTAAQAAVAAAAAAVPPNPPPLAAAIAAAQQAATTAQATLAADRGSEAADQGHLAADQRTLAAVAMTARTTATAAAGTVTAVYDVAYNTAGRAVAWVPADYHLRG